MVTDPMKARRPRRRALGGGPGGDGISGSKVRNPERSDFSLPLGRKLCVGSLSPYNPLGGTLGISYTHVILTRPTSSEQKGG